MNATDKNVRETPQRRVNIAKPVTCKPLDFFAYNNTFIGSDFVKMKHNFNF